MENMIFLKKMYLILLKADLIINFLEKYNPDDMSGPMRFDTHRDETIDMIHDG